MYFLPSIVKYFNESFSFQCFIAPVLSSYIYKVLLNFSLFKFILCVSKIVPFTGHVFLQYCKDIINHSPFLSSFFSIGVYLSVRFFS